MKSAVGKLKSVFGALAHTEPEPSRRDAEAQEKQQAEAGAFSPEPLPGSPVYHQETGVLLTPTKRFDGSSDDPPWNVPEPVLWDWLRTVDIEPLPDGPLTGAGGALWVRYRNYDGQARGALLRLAGVLRQYSLDALGAEYGLESPLDLLRIEQAAYEAMKAFGCEDLAPPLVAREIDPAPFLSAQLRAKLSRAMRVSPKLIDGVVGNIALLQALPFNAENFAEYWAKLGPDDDNRWSRASDRLRHSIYRSIVLDFLLGVPNRMLCDHLYNESSDSLALYGFEVSFPHPGWTAEWYLQTRSAGWGKKFSGPFEEPAARIPAGGTDSLSMISTLTPSGREEFVMTAKQMSDGFDIGKAVLLVQCLLEIGLSPASVSSMISRILFLENDPENILNGFDYVRSVLVPMRRGYGLDDGRIQMIASNTSETMTQAMGQQFDFVATVQEPLPDGVEIKI